MAWFGRRSTGVSGRDDARPVLSHGSGRWRAAEWPPSYEAQVRAGYLRNAVAQRAVKLVAESVGGAPLSVTPGEGGAALAALLTPAVLETLAAQLMLHGNAYAEVMTGEDGGAAGLFALRPERVEVMADASGWPAAYRYTVGERAAIVPAERMIHVRAFNPVDDHYGASCLGAAAAAIAVHNAAGRWHQALLDNAARPSGALVYDPGDGSVLSPEQFRRLKEEMEAAFAGAGNAGRPMLLEGGLKWQALSLSPADMDFAGTKAAAAREIALAFGVPPMLLGLPGDSTHANYKEANKALWRLTVLPMAGTLLSAMMRGLAEWLPDVRAEVDLDLVPALVEDRERLWRMVQAATFITDHEKRQMVGWAQ